MPKMISNWSSSQNQQLIASWSSLYCTASMFWLSVSNIVLFVHDVHAVLQDNLLFTCHLDSSPDAFHMQHVLLVESQMIDICDLSLTFVYISIRVNSYLCWSSTFCCNILNSFLLSSSNYLEAYKRLNLLRNSLLTKYAVRRSDASQYQH